MTQTLRIFFIVTINVHMYKSKAAPVCTFKILLIYLQALQFQLLLSLKFILILIYNTVHRVIKFLHSPANYFCEIVIGI
jgi:hypothetical protein